MSNILGLDCPLEGEWEGTVDGVEVRYDGHRYATPTSFDPHVVHIELRGPVSPTGYLSHFTYKPMVFEAGGPERYIRGLVANLLRLRGEA